MINSETAKTVYTTIAGVTEYPIGFVYYTNPDETPQLRVNFDLVTNEPLIYGTDYTISEDGLSIVLAEEPEEGTKLIITRNVPFTQTSDYVIGRIDPDQIERDFDLAVMRSQQAIAAVNDSLEMVADAVADAEEAVETANAASESAGTAAETVVGYENRMQAVETGKVAKAGDTMSGPLTFTNVTGAGGVYGYRSGVVFFYMNGDTRTQLAALDNQVLMPYETDTLALGGTSHRWLSATIKTVYTPTINNGHDITVPVTNTADTLALKSQVDLAANSGRMLTDEGVWYAKMDPNSTVPSSAEVEGRNYADFTQTDQDSNPILVIYTYTSGAWDAGVTVTLPAYDGYVPVTSKIWDIPEQTGQQGGRVLWNHESKEFTPYPQIISTDNMNITNSAYQGSAVLSGTSTVVMPVDAGNTQIANKGYVDSAIISSAFDLFDFKWKDCTLSRAGWALSDGNWIGKVGAGVAYQHLVDDIDGKTLQTETIGANTVSFYLADDGHKICPDTEEATVAAIYAATGVAWYYVLDTTNEQFKLPRVNSSTEELEVIPATVDVKSTKGNKVVSVNYGTLRLGIKDSSASSLLSPYNNNADNQWMRYDSSGTAGWASLYADIARSKYFAGKKYLYFFVGT